MLDFIRSNKRFLQFVLLLFIVPSFVIVGAWDMVSPNAGASVVAVVDGRADIYLHDGGQYEWDNCAPAAVALAAIYVVFRLVFQVVLPEAEWL